MLNSLKKRLGEQGAVLNIDNAVRFFLAEEGYDPIYGARPLRRSITKFLEDKLAEECLSYTLHEGTNINVTQKIKPDIYGSRPVYSPIFDDIYKREIEITFDYSNVDFSQVADVEEKDKTNDRIEKQPSLRQKIIEANKRLEGRKIEHA